MQLNGPRLLATRVEINRLAPRVKINKQIFAVVYFSIFTGFTISIKILKAWLDMSGMPGHTYLNLHDQVITLIDMKLYAQNRLYTSFSFWDLKALIASLGMPGHDWHHYCKMTSSICSFNRYVPACKKSTLYL